MTIEQMTDQIAEYFRVIQPATMNKIFLVVLLCSFACSLCSQTIKLDTIYYDKNWKGAANKAFATYFRVFEDKDKSAKTAHFRDYYITGELQGEGLYVSIDRKDDKNSVFDGEITEYYKNGLISEHGTYINGKYEGLWTAFNEAGDVCTQVEMANGKPKYDYKVVSNKDGFSNKIRISDNTPIWESPTIDEKKTDFKDGAPWPYYIKNGLIVAMTNAKVKDYGKWYQISLVIGNHTTFPIEFDPDRITSFLEKPDGKVVDLEVWSSDRYMKRVRRTQNWNMAVTGFVNGLAAGAAGYAYTSTQIKNQQGAVVANSQSVFYNGTAAFQAQMIANGPLEFQKNMLLQERANKEEGYLRKTTIHPGEVVCGYVNIERISGSMMTVVVDIHGAQYTFPWNIDETNKRTDTNVDDSADRTKEIKFSVRKDRH